MSPPRPSSAWQDLRRAKEADDEAKKSAEREASKTPKEDVQSQDDTDDNDVENFGNGGNNNGGNYNGGNNNGGNNNDGDNNSGGNNNGGDNNSGAMAELSELQMKQIAEIVRASVRRDVDFSCAPPPERLTTTDIATTMQWYNDLRSWLEAAAPSTTPTLLKKIDESVTTATMALSTTTPAERPSIRPTTPTLDNAEMEVEVRAMAIILSKLGPDLVVPIHAADKGAKLTTLFFELRKRLSPRQTILDSINRPSPSSRKSVVAALHSWLRTYDAAVGVNLVRDFHSARFL